MAFHEVRFPASLSFGSVGGPERRTEIVTLANGYEERNSPWAHARRRYDAGLGLRALADLEALVAFFEARQGQLHGFRWKDWADFSSAEAGQATTPEDQVIATTDGTSTVYSLTKSYRSGAQTYLRSITKPVAATVRISVAGIEQRETRDWELDAARGLITFYRAPEAGMPLTAGYEFDVPVRFDTDRILVSVASFRAGEVPNVPVIEVRL